MSRRTLLFTGDTRSLIWTDSRGPGYRHDTRDTGTTPSLVNQPVFSGLRMRVRKGAGEGKEKRSGQTRQVFEIAWNVWNFHKSFRTFRRAPCAIVYGTGASSSPLLFSYTYPARQRYLAVCNSNQAIIRGAHLKLTWKRF